MEKHYDVHITKYALEQLEEIKQYITYELSAPQAAKNLLSAMKCEMESLKDMPARNPLVMEEKWRAQGIRRAVVKNFFVYYWIDEEGKRVYVTAVVYGRRDQVRQLEEMEGQ